MFQETLREVNSRFPLIHQKGAKESAELVGPCSPIRGGEELRVTIQVFPFRMSHLLLTWQPWALEQLGKWKTKGIVHDVYLYPQYHDLNTTSLHTPPLCTVNRCTHCPNPQTAQESDHEAGWDPSGHQPPELLWALAERGPGKG